MHRAHKTLYTEPENVTVVDRQWINFAVNYLYRVAPPDGRLVVPPLGMRSAVALGGTYRKRARPEVAVLQGRCAQKTCSRVQKSKVTEPENVTRVDAQWRQEGALPYLYRVGPGGRLEVPPPGMRSAVALGGEWAGWVWVG